jgi:ribosome-associated translation inhibitor RaiA
MTERLHWSFSLGILPERHAELRQLVDGELERLADQLAGLPPEAVWLHLDAERARPDPSRKVTLRLAIPDHLLRAEACGHDLAAAVRKAFARLFRGLGRVKAKLRGEPFWKQKWRRYQSPAGRRFAQFDEGLPREEIRTPADLERLWDDASAELSAYARRVLRSARGPDGGRRQIEKRAAAALAESRERLARSSGEVPERISTRAGFYRALRDRLSALSGRAPPGPERTAPGPATPRVDLPAAIDRLALHRDVFQLYFREGLEDFEIAWVLSEPLVEVRRAIADLNQNLRSILVRGGDDAVLSMP